MIFTKATSLLSQKKKCRDNFSLLAPPPGVEVVGAVDVVGHPLVVEAEEGLVVGQEPVDAAAALNVAELLNQIAIARRERDRTPLWDRRDA